MNGNKKMENNCHPASVSAQALRRASCAPKFWHFPTAIVRLSNIARRHTAMLQDGATDTSSMGRAVGSVFCDSGGGGGTTATTAVQLLIKIKNIFFEIRSARIRIMYLLLFIIV